VTPAAHYGTVKIHDYLSLEDILNQMKPIISEKPKHMELLDIGTNYGQHFGFILYKTSANKFKHLKISGNHQKLIHRNVNYFDSFLNYLFSIKAVYQIVVSF